MIYTNKIELNRKHELVREERHCSYAEFEDQACCTKRMLAGIPHSGADNAVYNHSAAFKV